MSTSSKHIRLLIVEDSDDDALLAVREVRRHGYEVESIRVQTEQSFRAALDAKRWHVAILDHALPSFNSMQALRIAGTLEPDLPCIVVSGTLVEEQCTEAFRAGARDFISKGRLTRLVPAIERELQEAQVRRVARAAAAAEAATRARLSAFFEISPDIISRLRPDGTILAISPAVTRILGWQPSELQGTHASELIHPDDRQRLMESLVRGSQGEVTLGLEVRLRTKAGHYVPIEISGTPIVENGRVVELMGLLRDISHAVQTREQLEAMVRERTAELEQVNAAKTRLISVVNHEFRNPLSGITAFADLLLRNRAANLSESQIKQLQIIRRSCESLFSLTEALGDLSKIDSGMFSLEPAEFDLAELAQEAREAFEPLALARGQQLRLALPGMLVQVNADRRRTYQVVSNLISNALKYSPEGRTVEMAVEVAGGEARLSVSDQGIGISPADMEKLFSPFFRASNEATQTQQGTGLGLAIARAIMERQGGNIDAHSELGRGSVFTMRLPAVRSNTAENAA